MAAVVRAIGRFHRPGDQFATGVNVDSVQGAITLSNDGGLFSGNAIHPNGIHVGVDKAKTAVNGEAGSVVSVPFAYNGAPCVVKVTVTAGNPGSGGFEIRDSAGAVLLSVPEQAFDAGSGLVVVKAAAA